MMLVREVQTSTTYTSSSSLMFSSIILSLYIVHIHEWSVNEKMESQHNSRVRTNIEEYV